jgi:hypothetical protein
MSLGKKKDSPKTHALNVLNDTTNNNTPLHNAVLLNASKTLIILKKNGENIDAKNNDGNTPLHIAAKNKNTNLFELLIELGADISIKNNDGNDPIDLAIDNRLVDVKNVDKITPKNIDAFKRHFSNKNTIHIGERQKGESKGYYDWVKTLTHKGGKRTKRRRQQRRTRKNSVHSNPL